MNGWATYYQDLIRRIYEADVRLMQELDQARRQHLQLEATVAGWRMAPPAEEFRGVGTYRWACTSPKKMGQA